MGKFCLCFIRFVDNSSWERSIQVDIIWFNISEQLHTYGSVNYFYRVTFLFHPFLSFALVPVADWVSTEFASRWPSPSPHCTALRNLTGPWFNMPPLQRVTSQMGSELPRWQSENAQGHLRGPGAWTLPETGPCQLRPGEEGSKTHPEASHWSRGQAAQLAHPRAVLLLGLGEMLSLTPGTVRGPRPLAQLCCSPRRSKHRGEGHPALLEPPGQSKVMLRKQVSAGTVLGPQTDDSHCLRGAWPGLLCPQRHQLWPTQVCAEGGPTGWGTAKLTCSNWSPLCRQPPGKEPSVLLQLTLLRSGTRRGSALQGLFVVVTTEDPRWHSLTHMTGAPGANMAEPALSAEGSRTRGRRLQGPPRGSQRMFPRLRQTLWGLLRPGPGKQHRLPSCTFCWPGKWQPRSRLQGAHGLSCWEKQAWRGTSTSHLLTTSAPLIRQECVSPSLLSFVCHHISLLQGVGNSHRSCILEEVTPLKLPSMLPCDSECPSAWVLSVTPFHRWENWGPTRVDNFPGFVSQGCKRHMIGACVQSRLGDQGYCPRVPCCVPISGSLSAPAPGWGLALSLRFTVIRLRRPLMYLNILWMFCC